MMVNAKILVIGATGTNGREIIRQLTVRGIAVRVLVRGGGRIRWETPLAQESEGDLDDQPSLERAMAGIDKVVVVAPVNDATARCSAKVIAAAGSAGVRHVVRFSTLGADRTADGGFLSQHGEADALLAASTLPFTILRPSSFLQNLLADAPMIKASGRIVAAVGDARLSFVDVRDLAEAAVRVLTEPNHERRTYVLTGPEALSYRDVARELTTLLARPITYHPMTTDAFERAVRAAGATPGRARTLAEIQAAFATDAFAEPTADLGELLARPPRRLADFLRDYADSFR